MEKGGRGKRVIILHPAQRTNECGIVVGCVCQSQVFGLSASREGSLDWGGLFAACVSATAAAKQSRHTDRAKSGRVVLDSVWLWFGLVCLDGGVSDGQERQQDKKAWKGWTDEQTDGRGRVRTYTFYIFTLTDRLDSHSLLEWENS